jgi:8-hydroxy-5-deazaflavin:NADPH oxidoreductase
MELGTARAPRLAVLGAGHVGPVIARLAIKAGYQVSIATSSDPDNLALITELLIPGAEPRQVEGAIADADMVVLAIPLHRFSGLDPSVLADKLIIDAMNYWPSSDGLLEDFEGSAGSTEIVARKLPNSTVVKALNHIGYHELEENARPTGSPDRRATAVASDSSRGLSAVTEFVDRIGYDVVPLPSLVAGRVLQPGGPVFGLALARPEFERTVRIEPRRAIQTEPERAVGSEPVPAAAATFAGRGGTEEVGHGNW